MKIKDVATMAGVSHQAIYKRLKKRGISAESITDKATGELTAEGLEIMMGLYPQVKGVKPAPDATQPPAGSEMVEKLRSEVQRLSNELSNARVQLAAMTDERDYLRRLLEHTQEMESLRARVDVLEAGQRAARAQAITDGSDGGEGKRRGLFARWMGKGSRKGEP